MALTWRQRLSRTLGLRVAVWYAGVFLVTITGVGLLTYWLLVTSLEQRDHDLLEVKLAEYADRYETGGLMAVSRAVSAEQTSGSPDAVLVRLVGPRADVLLVSTPPAWGTFDLSQVGAAPPAGAENWAVVPSETNATSMEVVSELLPDGTVIQVGRTTVGRERFLEQVRHLLGFVIIAVLAAGLAGGAALTRSALGPLRTLRNTVRGIAHTGRLDIRVPADEAGDLVGEIGTVFNAMLTRIETLVDGMRGALDNVAHDLRTPIARLRARAESALASSANEAECRTALAECVEEADRVIALLSTLMDISEAETGTMHLTLEAVPVGEVVHDALDLYEDIADDRGIAMAAEVPDGLFVRADRQRLRQALANLVDNALKYTDHGGRVTIGATRDDGTVVITVADTGAGIAPDHLPRIWDRLYRADERSSERGLGLGLSLVRAIVAAHGGQADVTSELGKGSTFRVRLPAA